MRSRLNLNLWFLFLACSMFLFTPESTKSYADSSIRIMSYNIRYNTSSDGKNAWPHRKQMVAQTILFYKVDIIGIQEALYSQLQDLQALLPDFDWKGVGRDDGAKKGEFTPVFYRKNRFQIKASGNFWLSEEPDEPGLLGWDAACPRIATWIEFQDKSSGIIFYYFNTHFDHKGAAARKNSAIFLMNKINEIDEKTPVILSGDFNCTSQDEPYKILIKGLDKKIGLQNSMDISLNGHYGGTQTFNGFDEVQRPAMTIDFIFVRSVGHVLYHGIIAEKWNGCYASDHYPVVAEIDLKQKAKKLAEN